MRILTLLLAAASLGATSAPAMHPLASPTIYAHRGGATLAPENTFGAFHNLETVLAGRPVWIELDTHLTSDGVPVVIHDATLDRTTDCTGLVMDHTAAQLATCNAAAAFPGWPTVERIPLLKDVVARAAERGWFLMPEVKGIPTDADFDLLSTALADAVVAALDGFPRDRLIVQSFWPPSIDRVREMDPTIDTMLLTTSRLPGAPQHAGFTLGQNATFSTVRGYEVCAPDSLTVDLDANGVAYAHALGREVVVWTVNDLATGLRLAAAGVDGIITDDPSLFTGVFH